MGSEDENSHQSSPDSEKDVFRDTPIRYLGKKLRLIPITIKRIRSLSELHQL